MGSTIFKLVVVANQGVTALGNQIYDDGLFLRGAYFIEHGVWLGPYNNLTLAKGPMFPLWVATISKLSFPLPLANQLLYAAACGVAAIVTRSFLRSHWASTGLYVVLLFNPLTVSDGAATRLLRENIYPALTLLTVACAIGLWTRASGSPKNWIPWAAALGFSGAGFWLTREEGVWLVPVFLLAGISFLALVSVKAKQRWSRFVRLATPWAAAVLLASALVGISALVNGAVYGVPVISDVYSGSFPKAYGALARITPDNWQPDAPIPTDVRQKAYAVSPTLATIAPVLESLASQGPPEQKNSAGELRAGWFLWYLRDAAAAQGYYATAPKAQEFWNQVANEINTACSQGRIACGPPRSGMMPPLKPQYIAPFGYATVQSVATLTTFGGMSPEPTASSVDAAMLPAVYENTHAPLAGVDAKPVLHNPAVLILTALLRVYRWGCPVAALLGLAGTALAAIKAWQQRHDPRAIRSAALLVTLVAIVGARIALISLIDVTSFEAITPIYLGSAYGVMILWAYLGTAFLFMSVTEWRTRSRRSPPRSGARMTSPASDV